MGKVKKALLRTIPVMMGYVVLGIAFGLLLNSVGFNALWALFISLFVYAGSMQFVLVGLLSQQAPLATVAITTLLVNSRHLFYGLSFIEKFKEMGKKGFYMIFSLTDETYALLCSLEDDSLYFPVSLLNQLYWVGGSLIGSILGSLITWNSAGIEFAMTALFTVIVVEQWKEAKTHLNTLIGIGCGILSLILFGADRFLLISLIATVLLLLATKPLLERER